MTPGELRQAVRTADIFKMSLGKSARYRERALSEGVLIFQSEADFYDAVVSGDKLAIAAAGREVTSENHPDGNAPAAAIRIWKAGIETFNSLPAGSLVLHWEGGLDRLHWAITGEKMHLAGHEAGDDGDDGYLLHRELIGGWRTTSVGGVELSNLHPKARDLAINQATISRVQSHTDYFRALLLDEDAEFWESLPEWKAMARKAGWYAKPRGTILAARRKAQLTPMVQSTANHFQREIERMASTALHTAANANGQTVLTTVKIKDIRFTEDELLEEIAHLLKKQKKCCALTGFEFRHPEANPHLRPSLDRKDSSKGYIPGNLQIVTRGANFYKSASDEADWDLKARALHLMAIALQRRRSKPSV